MNYLITYNSTEVVSVIPVTDDTEILGGSEKIISTLANAIIMLSAIGIDTTPLNDIEEL